MFTTFRLKILASFALLIVLIIAPVLGFVNSGIDSVSRQRIEESLGTAQLVFDSFLESKRRSSLVDANSLVTSQPTIRAVLGSFGEQTSGAFGGTGDTRTPASELKEANELLYSSVESQDLYVRSQIFALGDEHGRILFTKSDPLAPQGKLSDIPEVKRALKGEEVSAYWGSNAAEALESGLVPKTAQPCIYQVFFKPISFGLEVKGVVIVGFAIASEAMAEIKSITQSEIAFRVKGIPHGASTPIENAALPLGGERHIAFTSAGEDYLGLVSPLGEKGEAILFRSKSREMAFYRDLQRSLNGIAVLAAILAVAIGIPLSRRVGASIRALIRGAEEVRAGNLDHVVSVKGRDEFAGLATAFNTMTAGLREKEAIKTTFRKYVNPRVVSALLESKDKLRLGGDRRDLVVYFADIAGFTTLAEALTPEATIEFLNRYLSQTTRLIEGAGGIVDKYMGDAVVAYWLKGSGDGEEERTACEVALKHRSFVRALQRELAESVKSRFDVRIGLHGGQAIIGNIGSEERMEYTIIGDTVNTASRLEAINKLYGTSILLSSQIEKQARGAFSLREIDSLRVMGKQEPVTLYELLDTESIPPSELKSLVDNFEAALQLYRAGEFSAAFAAFSNLALQYPGDAATRVFTERCRKLTAAAPPSWDGIYEASAK